MAKKKEKGKKKPKTVVEEKTNKLLVYELISIEDNFKEELNQNTRLSAVRENQQIFKGELRTYT